MHALAVWTRGEDVDGTSREQGFGETQHSGRLDGCGIADDEANEVSRGQIEFGKRFEVGELEREQVAFAGPSSSELLKLCHRVPSNR